MEAYPLHGGQPWEIAERFGIPSSELLDFSANINPAGPPPGVLTTLRACIDDLSILTNYPDLRQGDLKHALALYAVTNATNVIVANGFVCLMEAALRTLRIQTCLLPVPAFVEYRRTLERAGVKVILHTLSSRSMFAYDPEVVLGRRCDAIIVANPQNPSGICHEFAAMRDLVAKAAAKNTYVFLDEAFIDYVPEHSLTPLINEFPNLIIFRSVTKFHGIPGLRVAYALANESLSALIDDHLPPWPITTLASHAVIAAVDDQIYAKRSRSDNAVQRTALQADLERCLLTVYPSAGNFLLFQLPSTVNPVSFWRQMIVDQRIILRSCANYEGLPERHFRTAVRSTTENSHLVSSIMKTLSNLP